MWPNSLEGCAYNVCRKPHIWIRLFNTEADLHRSIQVNENSLGFFIFVDAISPYWVTHLFHLCLGNVLGISGKRVSTHPQQRFITGRWGIYFNLRFNHQQILGIPNCTTQRPKNRCSFSRGCRFWSGFFSRSLGSPGLFIVFWLQQWRINVWKKWNPLQIRRLWVLDKSRLITQTKEFSVGVRTSKSRGEIVRTSFVILSP